MRLSSNALIVSLSGTHVRTHAPSCPMPNVCSGMPEACDSSALPVPKAIYTYIYIYIPPVVVASPVTLPSHDRSGRRHVINICVSRARQIGGLIYWGQIPLTNGPSRDESVVYKYSFSFSFFLTAPRPNIICTPHLRISSTLHSACAIGEGKFGKKLGHHAPAIRTSPERAPHRVDCGCGHRRAFCSSCVTAGWPQCAGIYIHPPARSHWGMLN